MKDRVNWRMEYEILSWVLRQEKSAGTALANRMATGLPAPILDLETPRDEVVRNLLIEIETHDGPFGAGSLPESIS